MSKNLHLVPVLPLTKDQKFDKAMGCLTLSKAGVFVVEIIPTAGLHENAPKKPGAFKKLTQEEVLKMPDIDDRKRYVAEHEKVVEKEKQYVEDKKAFNEKILEELKTISWSWEVVGNGMKGKTIAHNSDFTIGIPKDYKNDISFPEILVGGGFAWLEVFTKNDPATGKTPHGLYVRATGIPQIVRIAWTDLDCKPITGKVKFGSKILLNIYTTHMYGQDLEVGLWDKDTADPNDLLPISNKDNFGCEVLVHKLLENEVNKTGISGGIKVKGKTESHVQKVRIPVLIDAKWMAKAGSSLKIFPTVKSKETGKFLKIPENCFLEVEIKGEKHETVTEPTNNPVLVGKVETNIASFSPCRYDKIELKKQDKAGSTILFDSSKDEQRAIKDLGIEIVTGKKETYLIDFDFQTLECERKPKHNTQEIIILTIPKDYELKIDPSSKAEHKVKKEEKELVKTESSNKTSTMGAKTTQKESVASEKGIVTVRQKQIEFDAFYNYDIPQDANALTTFYKAMKYFWLPNLSADKINTLTAVAKSCAFQQNINIAIYPDIKWTLKFGFNVKKEDIEKLNRKGGDFAPLKTFEDNAKEKDEANFRANENDTTEKGKKNNEANLRRKETLDNAEKYFTQKYDLKPKTTEVAPVDKGTSFKQLLEIMKRMTVSLEEEHYGGDIKNELTENFVKQIYEQLRPVILLAGKAIGIIEGDYDQKGYTPTQEKSIDGLMDKLKRKTVEYEILYPKLSFAGSWYYEQIDAKKYPALAGRQGLGIDLMLKAGPLLGVSIKWDILELLCRRHPIAYAVLKAIDALLYILADDSSAITCEFSVSGQIDTTVDFQYNRLAGFKEINAKGKTSIKTALEFKINIANTYKTLGYEAILQLGFGAGAEAGIGVTDFYGIDNKGFFAKKELEFEGIKLSFSATGIAQFKKGDSVNLKNSKPLFEIGGSIEGEVTFLNYKFETDKIYLIS
ncbi:hypothetical protein OA88_18895 [Flavobacterium sp. JRM]|nr:hypothetical protein OA88_18895 [Flavobacterium sp. JRM]